MINELIYLMLPAVISVFLLVFIRIRLNSGTWFSSNKNIAGQEHFNGLLVVSAPAFTACMGVVCLVSGENLGLLMLGVKLSIISMVLFVVSSVITPVLFVKKRNED